MRFLPAKYRFLLCGFILISFFIPGYKDLSAFSFIVLAFSHADKTGEINLTDVLVTITPLVLILLSALFIVVRTSQHYYVRKTYLAVPLSLLIFFVFILIFTNNNDSGDSVLGHMQVGFYLAALSSLLLIFTKNLKKRKRSSRQVAPETIAAA